MVCRSQLKVYLLKFALKNVIVVRCNLLRFGVNFDKTLLNKNIEKRIIFIYNNDIAAARVELYMVIFDKCKVCRKQFNQWCSGGGATGAIVPVPIFQGGAPLQFLVHFFLVNFAYILQKLAY